MHANDPDNYMPPAVERAAEMIGAQAEADAAAIRALLVGVRATIAERMEGREWPAHWWPVRGYDLRTTLDMLDDMTPPRGAQMPAADLRAAAEEAGAGRPDPDYARDRRIEDAMMARGGV